MKKILLITLFAMMLTAANSFATPIIDFSSGPGPVGGGIVTKVGTNAYTGQFIRIGALTVTGAPANNGTYTVTGPAGPLLKGSLDFDTVAGTISITGTVAALGITSPVVLLSGNITSFTATPFGPGNLFITAIGTDAKNPLLLAAVGLPLNTNFNFYGFSISLRRLTPDTWEGISTDIVNEVPEPTSIILLGGGLLAFAGVARKRLG